MQVSLVPGRSESSCNQRFLCAAIVELLSSCEDFSDSPGVRPSSGAASQEVRTAADKYDALRVSGVAAPEDWRTPPWLRRRLAPPRCALCAKERRVNSLCQMATTGLLRITVTQGLYRHLRALGLALLWTGAVASAAGASLGDTPTSFFTNVAERFLQSQLNVSVTRIQISPTSQYSPALHRLLQVAANLHEASKPAEASPFPSVFRPLFERSDSGVFICGYTNDKDAATARTWFIDNPEGIPLVVGARKGLPNFNEFVFQTAVQYTRKLELVRPATNALPNQTNQILLLSLSNLFGVENWNSYSTPFTNNFDVFVTNILSLTLSNAADGWATNPPPFQIGRSFSVDAATNGLWHFDPRFPARVNYQGGFMFPLYTNITLLPVARYTEGGVRHPDQFISAEDRATAFTGLAADNFKSPHLHHEFGRCHSRRGDAVLPN